MSSALAIAGVTAVLTDLLNNGVIDNDITPLVGPVKVSAKPPDRVVLGGGTDPNQLNLFLYHVAPNPGWRNRALPSRDGEGARLTNPPLALDLFYLLTAYGEKDFQAEILLGYAMQLFHETPVLTRDAIRMALAGPNQPPPVIGSILPANFSALVAADLAEQVEQIKIIPQSMGTEEMSKLWTALQTSYRPTAAYQVSVVLIESRRSTRPTLPVRERKLFVMPFRQPTIETVSPQIALVGDKLTLAGNALKGDISKVRFGALTVDPDTLSDDQLEVAVPVGLLAGVNTVQVVHSLDFGTPHEPHRGFASNVAAFMVAPGITTAFPLTVARGATLMLSVTPPVGRSQRVALLVGDQTVFIPNRPPTDPATSTNLNFPIPADFPTGTLLLRVQVDGAESSLTVDASGKFDGPEVTIS
jgi:hypothetical protein